MHKQAAGQCTDVAIHVLKEHQRMLNIVAVAKQQCTAMLAWDDMCPRD